MKFSSSRFLVFTLAVTLFIDHAHAQVVEIPDSNLESAIREKLQLPQGQPITQQEMLKLTRWKAIDIDIIDLTGIKYATNSISLDLGGNDIHDIQPLASLTNLDHLSLWNNEVEDIRPLASLTNLNSLELSYNNISDVSPLADLINLQYLRMKFNLATDFSSLDNLNLIVFEYDEVCTIPPQPPLVRERIENRNFPSVFAAWGGIGWSPVVNRQDLSDEGQLTLHDLHWHPSFNYSIDWDLTVTEPNAGLATSLAGTLSRALKTRQRRLDQNPNMIFLGGFANTAHFTVEAFPPNSDLWLRDQNGQILRKRDGKPLIDFVKPEFQSLMVERAVAFAQCGLYDGIMLDEFRDHGIGFDGRDLYPYTDEEIIQAYTNVFQAIRAQVREDFLILINVNETKPTRYTEYINGIMMETFRDHPGGYSHDWLQVLESTLSWAEENLREPRINCIEAQGLSIEAPDGPNNLRMMRVITTLSLTHSDGYVLYTDGRRGLAGSGDHDHLWHDFWDADLGRPISPQAQMYQDIEGLFIREFTNGWAVYNRSRKAQEISLPRISTSVSSNKQDTTHLLPDLDGEIYLRKGKPFDVNGDGLFNVLDLIFVSQHLGSIEGDINGDGITNILDLTLIAQQFNY